VGTHLRPQNRVERDMIFVYGMKYTKRGQTGVFCENVGYGRAMQGTVGVQ
jgi:hypothetical protein